MDELRHAGLHIARLDTLRVATLRYCAVDDALGTAVQGALAARLPGVQQCGPAAGGEVLLAWRSPTETLCLTQDFAPLAALAEALREHRAACLIELTGGLPVVRLNGNGRAQLLRRLGGSAALVSPGESRRIRLADVAVQLLSAGGEETLLLVERCYLPHVWGWMRETVTDFAAVSAELPAT